jgi:hypothetical protein
MKIILSRKGFDSSAGGHASPILPTGEMFSLPIPSSLDSIRYEDLVAPQGATVKTIIKDLDSGARIAGKGAHADPDLVGGMRPRHQEWRPSLGQINQASGHLRNQKVGPGDLFLFYGYFRHSEMRDGRLSFRKNLPEYHAIYAYLEVDEIIWAQDKDALPNWLADHPHAVESRLAKSTNSIYVARESSERVQNVPGAGVFRFRDGLVLTKSGLTRSRWDLDPDIFRHLTITYHRDSAWKEDHFKSYPRAQEYVIHADSRAEDWAYDLICSSETWDI